MRTFTMIAGLAAALVATPVMAQDASQDTALEGDYITAGIAAGYIPSYRGSDDHVVTPVPLVMGRIGGMDINPRAGGASLDLIPDAEDAKIGFILGPVAVYTGNRANQIKDRVVRASGKLDIAVEVGGTIGITAYRLLNPYDELTFSNDIRWDVAGGHKGRVWTPSLSYLTPLSKGAAVVLNVSARQVDDDFAQYYYSVNPVQNARTGGALPLYDADDGFDSVNVGLFGTYDLDNNLLNGGLQIIAAGFYSRMMNDAKDTPFTSLRGDADQWIGGLGVAYTF